MTDRTRYRRYSTQGARRLGAYAGKEALFGDIHNHCGISYGHGNLDEALRNAGERLDFCSVTGHAFWPDMPESNSHNKQLIGFHKEGFSRLRTMWPEALSTFSAHNVEGEFVTFPSFEMHSDRYGDHTIMYREIGGEIVYADGLPELRRRLAQLSDQGVAAIAFPHHIGYKRGQRGINWDAFTPEVTPIVEIVSMHGCSERDEAPRPFLHTMGPADHESTMVYGLRQGHIFGVTGSTDHHSAHPGSYGHGMTGVWAESASRKAIWDAIQARRTFALTGDRMAVQFAVNGSPMGAVTPPAETRRIELSVKGGGPLDYVDVVKNGRLLSRISRPDIAAGMDSGLDSGIGAEGNAGGELHTLVYLEVGWGPRNSRYDWDIELGIDAGRIVSVEPRFRGLEVVSPLEGDAEVPGGFHFSHWELLGQRSVGVKTVTFGNPTNSTNTGQGICLEVEMPATGRVIGRVNDHTIDMPISRLVAGGRVERMEPMPSPSYLLHRAPLPAEYIWSAVLEDEGTVLPHGELDTYYLRVRQQNDQWAWSSPIFVRNG